MAQILVKRDEGGIYVIDCHACGTTFSFKEGEAEITSQDLRRFGYATIDYYYKISCPNCKAIATNHKAHLKTFADWEQENKNKPNK